MQIDPAALIYLSGVHTTYLKSLNYPRVCIMRRKSESVSAGILGRGSACLSCR